MYPTEPPSQPDPMAFLHAAPPSSVWNDSLTSPYREPSVSSRLPSDIGVPPPPPLWNPHVRVTPAPSAPSRIQDRLIALGIGSIIGIVLMAGTMVWLVRSGGAQHLFAPNSASSRTSAPTHSAATRVPPTHTPAPLLTVTISCLRNGDQNQATLCVQTTPAATLAIAVLDCDSVIDPNAPTTGTADDAGQYRATWSPRNPNGNCRTATITVRATLNDRHGQATANMMINHGGDGG